MKHACNNPQSLTFPHRFAALAGKKPAKSLAVLALALCLALASLGQAQASPAEATAKPSPDKIVEWLTEGNARFMSGQSVHPHADAARLNLADTESQAKYALATVLSCSDSRVPAEILFDAGIMDLFIVRVAGNVANTDEIGSIEYGLCHVNTPVLVVMGHTQCGAVTAVAEELTGHGHPLERNIPPLVASIVPAVKRTIAENPQLAGKELVAAATDANVWEVIRNILLKSPAVREQVKSGKVKIAPAIYDLHTGGMNWLPAERVAAVMAEVEASPDRATAPMYGQEDKAQAPKASDLVAKLESKADQASGEMKDMRGKMDAMSADVKNMAAAMEKRMSALEVKPAADLPWLTVVVLIVVVAGFILLLRKIKALGGKHEELSAKLGASNKKDIDDSEMPS